MAAEETTSQGNVTNNFNAGQLGLNMDNTVAQVKKGMLTYALNASVENFDASSVNYQNEQGNEPCGGNTFFPSNYALIGHHFIAEKNKHIYFIVNAATGASQIGYMINNDCVYRTLLSASCLAFDVNYPIHKVVHKITNCTTEIYWTDGKNPRRYLDIDEVPLSSDCNLLKVQPDFTIPKLVISDIYDGGEVSAGSYQFSIQYANANGIGYTSYYSVTNPVNIGMYGIVSTDFNYPVNKSIVLDISNIDDSGFYDYYNIAVIKTINGVSSVELVGTYLIDSPTNQITYTGQNKTQIKLSLNDIFEKFPYYDIAQDLTSVQDILVWDNLISNDRINFQKVASQITLNWESYKIPVKDSPVGGSYADPKNTALLRGYLRDEVYAFEIVFLLKNGKQTDGFHIPGRSILPSDEVDVLKSANNDFISVDPTATTADYWTVYNTATRIGPATGPTINGATPYEYGTFGFWQSSSDYPNNPEVWGSLAGTPIRHHKFPDIAISPAFDSPASTANPSIQTPRAIYPLGVRVDIDQIKSILQTEGLYDIVQGFKIVRGNRNTNRSITAKGIVRNVGKYTREGTTFMFPNYPYNDLRQDPFLLADNNLFINQCYSWIFTVNSNGSIQYKSCSDGSTVVMNVTPATPSVTVCSAAPPVVTVGNITGPFKLSDSFYSLFTVIVSGVGNTQMSYYPIGGSGVPSTAIVISGIPTTLAAVFAPSYISGNTNFTISQNTQTCLPETPLNGFSDANFSKSRFVFNSPDTSFIQPSLGNVLKLESSIYGAGKGHFVKVKDNAEYKLITDTAQKDALNSSYNLASVTGTFDAAAMFTVYQSYLTIYINGISRINFGYTFNSIASYDYSIGVPNNTLGGVKQRMLDNYQYLLPGVQSVDDLYDVNNFQRESSVYLKTAGATPLPYAQNAPSVPAIIDDSRFTISEKGNCQQPERETYFKSVTYYASIKNMFLNQWGDIYTYETIDTGFQIIDINNASGINIVFGGDTFIGKFALKTKLPFFINNRVGAPDDSDIEFDQLGNVAYPKYWHSSRSVLSDYTTKAGTVLQNMVSIKAHNFDCDSTTNSLPSTLTTSTTAAPSASGFISPSFVNGSYIGKMYLFAYGIPYFYCESSINTDLRQAFNNLEGDYYPRVSSGIPDQWLQQVTVPIAFDNTYYYNVSFSKQNTENNFTHLPIDWTDNQCQTIFPFRAIYSDTQISDPTNRLNNWLIYRPISYFDFPQTFGDLVSLDGIQNRAILARFENKSLLYNTMLTINTSNPQAAYLGNDTLFRSSPPIDFAETDLGYVGTQNKFLLKIPQGQVTVDAKRGQIFLISGNSAVDLTAFGSGVNRFMTDHLAFEILRYFPEINLDNHFNGIGLHGVYDSKFDRVIITKLDYIPQPAYVSTLKYGSNPLITSTYSKFYIESTFGITVIDVNNPTYFCNKSWTMSYNFNTQSWISFHTYLPNYYIAENNFFYSGINRTLFDSQSATSGSGSGTCNLTFVAAVVTSEVCKLPSGNAVTYNPTTTTTTSSTSSTSTTSTTSTSTSTSTTSSTTSSTSTSTSTTSSTTTAIPTTTTTSTTIAPGPTTTTTTTPYVGPSTTTSTTSSTTSTTSTSTSTSTSSTSTTTSTTTLGCVPLVYGVDWTITGNQIVAQDSTEDYTITALTTNPNNYPITGIRSTAGGTGYPPTIFTLTGPGDSHVSTMFWNQPLCDGNLHFIGIALTNSCTPNVPENYYNYYVTGSACGGTTTTTSTTSAPGPTTSTTTSTSTTALATVFLDPRNSLNTGSYTPYINGISDPSWDFGSRSYPLGTTIRIDYNPPACNVTLNGSAYSSGTTITLSTVGTRTFTLLNADNYVNNGSPVCAGNELRQPTINDCGNTSYNVISTCSCSCNVECNGTYFGGNYCDGNALKRTQYYYCNGAPTGYVETISSCSCDCNVGCNGTYWAETCSGTTLNRVEKYTCNNSNTGNTQTIPCSATCGASTTPNWVNSGGTYCITGSCTLRQDQVQTNPCAAGTTRTINTGEVNESCGSWDLQYYCVGFDLWSQEINSCTSATRNQTLVEVNSPTCGYVPPSYSAFSISLVGNEFNVCTRAVDQTAYCLGGVPSVGKTIYTDAFGSSTLGAGYYATNDGFIILNSGGVVTSDGIC